MCFSLAAEQADVIVLVLASWPLSSTNKQEPQMQNGTPEARQENYFQVKISVMVLDLNNLSW